MGDSPRIGRLDDWFNHEERLVYAGGSTENPAWGQRMATANISLNGLHCKKDALRASKKSALHSRYLVQSSG